MKRFKVTTVQYFHVGVRDEPNAEVTQEAFTESFQDHLLDSQDAVIETSDEKFEFVPQEFTIIVEEA